eukprot:g22273.t1
MEINERLTADYSQDYRKNIRCIFISLFFSVSLTLGLHIRRVVDWQAGFLASDTRSAVTLGPLFDAYLLNIGGQHGNKLVGAVESTRGVLQLAFAYPIGALSDKMSRVRLLKGDLLFWTLGLFLLLLGIASGSVVIADSAASAARTTVLSRMTSLRLIAQATGPMLQACMLLLSGQNHWGTSLLKAVTLSGAVLWPGVMWTLRMSDVPPLEKTEGESSNSSTFSQVDLDRCYLRIPLRWWVAGIIELMAFITLFGAGMTVKFFPLFFRIDYKFTPLEVCVLGFAYPFCISVMARTSVALPPYRNHIIERPQTLTYLAPRRRSLTPQVELCRRLSKHLGRLFAVSLFHFLGTVCLWVLCYIRPLVLVLPLYLLRGALMNARGIVFFTARSPCSLVVFLSVWLALLGGYLADYAGDYRFTFVVTASIYSAAFVVSLPLFFIYPAEHKAPAAARETSLQSVAPVTDSPAIARREESAGGTDLPRVAQS